MQEGGYEYVSQPRSVGVKRSKYRDPVDEDTVPQNIMYDRRVVRGSTYSMRNKNQAMQSPKRSSNRSRRRSSKSRDDTHERPSTPPAVDGRKHMDIQTEAYLEELTDKVPEIDEGTQTDSYMDRPAPPLFMPTKSGVDISTQIENGDLFDFNLEVEPILEVLVGKTLEVSVMEVLEEEELKQIRQHQETFEQARNAELAEVQRLEAEAKRKFQEKQRRIKEEQVKKAARANLEDKVAARSFAKHYLSDLHSTVFSNLMQSGHFYDPLQKEVTDKFIPFVLNNACAQVEKIAIARSLSDALISNALAKTQL